MSSIEKDNLVSDLQSKSNDKVTLKSPDVIGIHRTGLYLRLMDTCAHTIGVAVKSWQG